MVLKKGIFHMCNQTISKIELEEKLNGFNTSFIKIDLIHKNITKLQNDKFIKSQLNMNVEELITLVKKYVIYWDSKYINDKVIGGEEAKLIIYTDDEIIKYRFKNKYPYNYNVFIKKLKEMVGIV